MKQLICALAALVGCAGDDGSTDTSPIDTGCTHAWQPVSHVDDGVVCFGEVVAGQDITVEVRIPDCLSSSCDQAFQGACTVTDAGGGALTLTSDISWETETDPLCPCTDDCGLPAVTCTLPGGLPDGSYDVSFGGQTLTLTVPSDEPCGYY